MWCIFWILDSKDVHFLVLIFLFFFSSFIFLSPSIHGVYLFHIQCHSQSTNKCICYAIYEIRIHIFILMWSLFCYLSFLLFVIVKMESKTFGRNHHLSIRLFCFHWYFCIPISLSNVNFIRCEWYYFFVGVTDWQYLNQCNCLNFHENELLLLSWPMEYWPTQMFILICTETKEKKKNKKNTSQPKRNGFFFDFITFQTWIHIM